MMTQDEVRLEVYTEPKKYEDIHGWFSSDVYGTVYWPSGHNNCLFSKEDVAAAHALIQMQPKHDAVVKLATLIQKLRCEAEETERNGGDIFVLVYGITDIISGIEHALNLDHGTIAKLGEPGRCNDPDCYSCGDLLS